MSCWQHGCPCSTSVWKEKGYTRSTALTPSGPFPGLVKLRAIVQSCSLLLTASKNVRANCQVNFTPSQYSTQPRPSAATVAKAASAGGDSRNRQGPQDTHQQQRGLVHWFSLGREDTSLQHRKRWDDLSPYQQTQSIRSGMQCISKQTTKNHVLL